MNDQSIVVIRIRRRALVILGIAIVALVSFLLAPSGARAQKVQENYKEKLDLTQESSGVGIAASADGKYVYVVGTRGVLVSDDYGKTGSWVQTVRLK